MTHYMFYPFIANVVKPPSIKILPVLAYVVASFIHKLVFFSSQENQKCSQELIPGSRFERKSCILTPISSLKSQSILDIANK